MRPNDNQTVIRKLILSLFREIFNWQEFLDRKAFAYIEVSLDERRVLGCVYINPTKERGYDALAYMWVRQLSGSVLSAYGLSEPRIKFLRQAGNTLFRIYETNPVTRPKLPKSFVTSYSGI